MTRIQFMKTLTAEDKTALQALCAEEGQRLGRLVTLSDMLDQVMTDEEKSAQPA